ncbi:tRNA preQ1(34) S-adenosylmethionine ribosyltransferase-isomerase QueA [Planctellipticum variicoloris]|uniref:tRNA preQ1(34) S-adenosylmethionine ribosyltransferase-isomerase QueA n=1 Tax=Planctellipticum variicoloris TaxID=3064265 RepID=UPI003013FF2C|nr:tRNA preQ1(34) S-adenosylmethionine ribosyltransferase-isomerase QueA [Planctomycetaceae bacterium SH412]
MPDFDRLETYDYTLPEELIAKEPLARRDASRLLVVRRAAGTIEHRQIAELPELLLAGDCLVVNDSRVLLARLQGVRTRTGGKWEGLYLSSDASGRWRLIGQTRGKLQPGEELAISATGFEPLRLTLIERIDEGGWLVEPLQPGSPVELLERYGQVPLPPYMDREQPTEADRERYQTTYARNPGSVAAPTAGLHFSPELLAACAARGIDRTHVTLHVGMGTFRPVSVEDVREHVMHSEWCELSTETAAKLQSVKAAGGRVVSVGTTSLRTLESAVAAAGWRAWSGETRLFIRPPYQFQAVDVLLTNFHLPKSTLLMLVSAFGGYELIREAYREAVSERYRFFSYGDAMLVL